MRSVEWPPSVLVEKVALSTSDGAVSHLTLRVCFILTVNHGKMGQIYSQGTHGSKSQNKTKRICEPVACWFFEKPPRFGFCPNPRAHGEGAVARRRPAGCPNMFAEFEDDDDYDEVDEDQQKQEAPAVPVVTTVDPSSMMTTAGAQGAQVLVLA